MDAEGLLGVGYIARSPGSGLRGPWKRLPTIKRTTMTNKYLKALERRKAATEKAIAAMVKKAAKALKVDGGKIPGDYLAFLRESNGASGEVGEREAYVHLDEAGGTVKNSQGYEFAERGWLLIGGDGAGTGYA